MARLGSTLRGAQRYIAEPAALVRSERLRRRHVAGGLDGVRRLAYERRLARNLTDALTVADIFRPHHDRTSERCRPCEHVRSHFEA